MKISETKKKLAEIQAQQDIQRFQAELNRARSVTVGTAFGGTTEVSIRGNGGVSLWCPMQPVEVIELIHQLAASVGCHIHLQPRQDFSSWREWKHTEEDLAHYRGHQYLPGVGHPPFSNNVSHHHHVGANLPPPEAQPGLKIEVPVRSKENVVATKKTVNGRSVKRRPKTA